MLRSSINELNVDGCNIPFFNMLAQHGPKHYLSGFPLQIPISIFFESGIPRAWYGNAADGTIAKKEARHFNADDIWHAFVRQTTNSSSPQRSRKGNNNNNNNSVAQAGSPRATTQQQHHRDGGEGNNKGTSSSPTLSSSEDDIIAVLISVPPPSYESDQSVPTVTHHLTRAMLRQLLFHRDGEGAGSGSGGPGFEMLRVHRRFLLQQFHYPQGWYNSVIRVTWAPKLAVVEALRSTCSLRDTWKQPDARGGTFENPNEAVRTSMPDSVHQAVKETCQYIAMHLGDVTGGANVAGMLLYFKINANRELLLLYPGSVRVHLQSSPPRVVATRTSPPLMSLAVESGGGVAGGNVSSSSTPPPCDTLPSPLSPGHRLPSLSPGRMASISKMSMVSLDRSSSIYQNNPRTEKSAEKKPPFLNVWHEVSSGAELKRKTELDVALSPKNHRSEAFRKKSISEKKLASLQTSPQQRLSPIAARRLFEKRQDEVVKSNEQQPRYYQNDHQPDRHNDQFHSPPQLISAQQYPSQLLRSTEKHKSPLDPISGTRPIATTEELYVAAARNLGIPIPRGLQRKFGAAPASTTGLLSMAMNYSPAKLLLQRHPGHDEKVQPPPPRPTVNERLQQSPYFGHQKYGNVPTVNNNNTKVRLSSDAYDTDNELRRDYLHSSVAEPNPLDYPALPEARRWEVQQHQNQQQQHHIVDEEVAPAPLMLVQRDEGYARQHPYQEAVLGSSPQQQTHVHPTYFRINEPTSPSLEFVLRNQQRYQKNSVLRAGVRLHPIAVASGATTNHNNGGRRHGGSPSRRVGQQRSPMPQHYTELERSTDRRQNASSSPSHAPPPFDDTSAMEQFMKHMSDEQVSGIHFPLPYMRTDENVVDGGVPPLTSANSSWRPAVDHHHQPPLQSKPSSKDKMKFQYPASSVSTRKSKVKSDKPFLFSPNATAYDSFAASLRSLESALHSPLASTMERRQALEALEDLLYCIRGALPKSQPTKHRHNSAAESSNLDFGFDPSVLPPELVTQAFSPLGAEVKHPVSLQHRTNDNHRDTVTDSIASSSQNPVPISAHTEYVIPSLATDAAAAPTFVVTLAPPPQQSDLLKAVHLCEQNIKQYKRRGKMNFQRHSTEAGVSSPTAISSKQATTSPNLEYLFDFYEETRLLQHPTTSPKNIRSDSIVQEAPAAQLAVLEVVSSVDPQVLSASQEIDTSVVVPQNNPLPALSNAVMVQYSDNASRSTSSPKRSTSSPVQSNHHLTPPQEVLHELLATLPRTPPCTLLDL
ncbi:Hypothetical protein, putative [Bodo saltans]|uniref:Uncharacterized protein n=1 Tax=Bodo saltans TaxID=75058 RepID=A0A0S4IYG9_BODSA|nr:Hypothetical protein, putative [Bodo saltans]|eukprot:CUG21047.1 Hypothetical protein, putative [Bodo saltans]